MDIEGEQLIKAPQQVVWDALNDADVLQQCIAGAEDLVKVSATEFSTTIMAKVGPVKARFKGNIVLSDMDEPIGYSLAANGKGAAGFCKGKASVSLARDGDATVLTYKATATVGGKLAQVGARLIHGVAKKMAHDFFTTFTQIIATEPGEQTTRSVGAADREQKS